MSKYEARDNNNQLVGVGEHVPETVEGIKFVLFSTNGEELFTDLPAAGEATGFSFSKIEDAVFDVARQEFVDKAAVDKNNIDAHEAEEAADDRPNNSSDTSDNEGEKQDQKVSE